MGVIMAMMARPSQWGSKAVKKMNTDVQTIAGDSQQFSKGGGKGPHIGKEISVKPTKQTATPIKRKVSMDLAVGTFTKGGRRK